MDMIYTDSNLIDQGVLQDYSFDMEYGIGEKDTNTFECMVQKYNDAMHGDNPIGKGSLIYIEFTEYGGIVDRIESDVKTGVITLKGRTWHGILNSFVIEPPMGNIYRIYNGSITEVLTQMIADAGASSLFAVDGEDADEDEFSRVVISAFEVRYEHLYDAIIRMLTQYNGKFKCYYYNGKVRICGVLAVNYAVTEEFDSSQMPFKVGITYNNVNHMICLGQGDGIKRAVIHLFTDEDGKIQPYTTVEEPLQDSDYILDKSQQVLTGVKEIAYVYDYPNAEIVHNYPPLDEEPEGWESDYYKKYYERGNDDSNGYPTYNLIERVFKDRFHLLTSPPSNWYVQEGYKNYYTCDATGSTGTPVQALQEGDPECEISYTPAGGKYGAFWDWQSKWKDYYEYDSVSGDYTQVNSDYQEDWVGISSIPVDWNWHFGNYSTRWWDGVKYQYTTVQGVSRTEYEPQTSKPDDWETKYGSYYVKAKKTKKNSKGKVEIKKGAYITISQAMNEKWLSPANGKAYPTWKKGKFYTSVNKTDAPGFPGVVYYRVRTEKAPVWEDGRYYKREVKNTPKFKLPNPSQGFYGYWELHKNEEQIPTFVQNKYYYEVEDRYRILIQNALEKLNDLCDTSTLDIDLELAENYDVGDVVGSIDEVTGIEVNKPILRKVIKIKKDIISISHEVE